MDKVYAAANKQRTYYRFHINKLQEFKERALDCGFSDKLVEWKTGPEFTPKAADLKLKDGWVARDYQASYVEYLSKGKQVSKFVNLQTGKGKACPTDAPVKIPGGWTTHGELKVGQSITAADGTPTVVTGIYPAGEQEIWKITFQDGRTAECTLDHLWKAHRPNKYYSNGNYWEIIDTAELIRVLSLSNNRIYIPLCEPEKCEKIDLPLHPYLLGVLIGDGGFRHGCITLTTPDEHIVEKVNEVMPKGVELVKKNDGRDIHYRFKKRPGLEKNLVLEEIRSLGLADKLSYYKFIPAIYINASTDQRRALLQGLMDTDGTAGKGGECDYSTSSYTLAQDVVVLVRSLGGRAWIAHEQKYYTYKGKKLAGKPSYRIHIAMKHTRDLFTLPKKRTRVARDNQYSEYFKLSVVGAECVGEKRAVCISIDHPEQLYVTNDYVVTHNTLVSLLAASELGLRLGIFVKSMYADKWYDDVLKTFAIGKDRIAVIRGSASLLGALTKAKEGTLDVDVLIFSLSTIQQWIASYEELGGRLEEIGYPCRPEDMFNLLGIGTKIVDEVHQHFHAMFKLDMYTHVKNSMALSATLFSKDPFLSKMYEVMFPLVDRSPQLALDRYANAFAVHFNFDEPNKIRTSERGSTSYSHNALEASIIRHTPTLKNYLELVNGLLVQGYFKHPREKKKAIIFASSIDMCTRMTEYFKNRYPHLDIRRYVGEDPYENAIEPDIRFTTNGSCGAAIDIPDLVCNILTQAISSVQANVQVLGRLRKLADGSLVNFYFLTADNIPKHVEYYVQKKEMLAERAATFKEIFMDIKV